MHTKGIVLADDACYQVAQQLLPWHKTVRHSKINHDKTEMPNIVQGANACTTKERKRANDS